MVFRNGVPESFSSATRGCSSLTTASTYYCRRNSSRTLFVQSSSFQTRLANTKSGCSRYKMGLQQEVPLVMRGCLQLPTISATLRFGRAQSWSGMRRRFEQSIAHKQMSSFREPHAPAGRFDSGHVGQPHPPTRSPFIKGEGEMRTLPTIFFGLPRGRSVDSKSKRTAVFCTHPASPYGQLR